MPSMFGKEKKKEQLINNLGELYRKIQKEHNISPGDFPPISKFQAKLKPYDFSKLHSLKQKLIDDVDKMLQTEVTRLMSMIPKENESSTSVVVRGGAFSVGDSVHNPFATGAGEGIHFGAGSDDWVIAPKKEQYDRIFETLNPDGNGKVTGSNAKRELVKSKLPNTVLGRIWKLSDLDKDGMLDSDEFAVAMHLIDIKLDGNELPVELPIHVVPPSKRKGYSLDYD